MNPTKAFFKPQKTHNIAMIYLYSADIFFSSIKNLLASPETHQCLVLVRTMLDHVTIMHVKFTKLLSYGSATEYKAADNFGDLYSIQTCSMAISTMQILTVYLSHFFSGS